MAFAFRGGSRDQLFLLPVSMRDWLPADHLVWFVIDVVEAVDTSRFRAPHPVGGPGRRAYDPDMMLALLFYAYLTGVHSSRRIESSCRTDAAYRVISGDVVPDHSTISRFLAEHESAIESVFVDVLRLCVAAGLVSVQTVAIDGTKISSNAALDMNRKAEWIRAEVQRIMGEAVAADAVEATQPLFVSESVPEEPASSGRLGRLEAALAVIEAEDAADKAEAEARESKARTAAEEGHKLRGRKPKDPHAALVRAEIEEHAERVKAQRKAIERAARKGGARGGADKVDVDGDPKVRKATEATALARAAAEAAPKKARVANITDPESRMMKTRTGFLQGFNCQAAVNENQIVLACTVTQQATDVGQFVPMITATRAMLDAVGVTDPIGVVLADAGYWSEANATVEGPDRLIATLKDYKQRQAARALGITTGEPPADATPIEAMEHRLRTPEGTEAYSKRSHTVEPVFADDKHNLGHDRFRRRGLNAASAEWALTNIVHNLGKLFRQQHGITVAVT